MNTNTEGGPLPLVIPVDVLSATEDALRVFDRHRPHIHRFKACTDVEWESLLIEWGHPLRALSPDSIRVAAVRFVGEREDIPQASTFAGFAHAVHADLNPAAAVDRAATLEELRAERKAHLADYFRERLGTTRLIILANAELMRAVGIDAAGILRVRNGECTRRQVDTAITAVLLAEGRQRRTA